MIFLVCFFLKSPFRDLCFIFCWLLVAAISKETLKKDERKLVDGRLKYLKKLIKVMKKSGKDAAKEV